MTKLKNYKGVDIFVSNNGVFYCDVKNNSNLFKDKTFNSKKLPSIEKAIDDFCGNEITRKINFYEIIDYEGRINFLTVEKSVGNRLFFNDNTDTSMYNRRKLYPEEVNEQKEFQDIKYLLEDVRLLNIELLEVSARKRTLLNEIKEKKKSLKLVSTV